MNSIQRTNSSDNSPRRRRRNLLTKLFCKTKSETNTWKVNLKRDRASAKRRPSEQDDSSQTFLADDTFTQSSFRSLGSDSDSVAPSSSGILKIVSQETSLRQSLAGRQEVKDTEKCSSCKVGFGDVTIQFHRLDLGNHPDVSSGVPITLGAWESEDRTTVDNHEQERQSQRSAGPWEPTLSAKQRERMLLDAGVPMQSIQRRIHALKIQSNHVLRQRLLSNTNKISSTR